MLTSVRQVVPKLLGTPIEHAVGLHIGGPWLVEVNALESRLAVSVLAPPRKLPVALMLTLLNGVAFTCLALLKILNRPNLTLCKPSPQRAIGARLCAKYCLGWDELRHLLAINNVICWQSM